MAGSGGPKNKEKLSWGFTVCLHVTMCYIMVCFAGYTCIGRHLESDSPLFEPLVFLLLRGTMVVIVVSIVVPTFYSKLNSTISMHTIAHTVLLHVAPSVLPPIATKTTVAGMLSKSRKIILVVRMYVDRTPVSTALVPT